MVGAVFEGSHDAVFGGWTGTAAVRCGVHGGGGVGVAALEEVMNGGGGVDGDDGCLGEVSYRRRLVVVGGGGGGGGKVDVCVQATVIINPLLSNAVISCAINALA